MDAPKVTAKGIDNVALRIKALAEEHDVPIVENPPLARALFASTELDQTIPQEHFKAVAEVIGYVMQLKINNRPDKLLQSRLIKLAFFAGYPHHGDYPAVPLP